MVQSSRCKITLRFSLYNMLQFGSKETRFKFIPEKGSTKGALCQDITTVDVVRNEMCQRQGLKRTLSALSKSKSNGEHIK